MDQKIAAPGEPGINKIAVASIILEIITIVLCIGIPPLSFLIQSLKTRFIVIFSSGIFVGLLSLASLIMGGIALYRSYKTRSKGAWMAILSVLLSILTFLAGCYFAYMFLLVWRYSF